MELSKEQINKIESYLANKKVDYIDLKIELLDHIISDVEQLILQKDSFELAFTKVRKKWNIHFRKDSSMYLGLYYTAPKIVFKKAVKEFRPYFFLYLFSYFLPFVLFTKKELIFNQQFINFTNISLKTLAVIALFYMLFVFIKIITSKVKTTYSFILKTQFFSSIFLLFPILISSYFDKSGKIIGVFVGVTVAGFTVTYICYHFYKKHLLAIKKNKNLVNGII